MKYLLCFVAYAIFTVVVLVRTVMAEKAAAAKVAGAAKAAPARGRVADRGPVEIECDRVMVLRNGKEAEVEVCADHFLEAEDFDYERWKKKSGGEPRMYSDKDPDLKVARDAYLESKKRPERSTRGDGDLWADLQKMDDQLRSAIAKREMWQVRMMLDAMEKKVSRDNNYYVAYNSEEGKIQAGVSPRIVEGNLWLDQYVNHLWRRNPRKQVLLDKEILGVGSVYTGNDVEVDGAVAWKSWDPRMSNLRGGEIHTREGSLRMSKRIAEADEVRGGLSAVKNMFDGREKVGFVHIPTDEINLRHSSTHDRVKLVLADPLLVEDKRILVVKAVLEGGEGVWRYVYGDANKCVQCATPELFQFLQDVQVLKSG